MYGPALNPPLLPALNEHFSVKPISSFTVSTLLLYTFIFSFVDVSRVCLTAGFALFETGTQLYLSKTPFVTRHV